MILNVVGGLCNRLRAMLSYSDVCGKYLTIRWEPNGDVCSSKFTDVFEPMTNLPMVDGGLFDVEDFAPHPNAHPDWVYAYKLLKPKPHIVDEIQWVLSGMPKDFAAIHIRRTDHTPNAQLNGFEIEHLIDYYHFAKEAKDLYIATDNSETFDKFSDCVRGLGPKVHQAREIPYSRESQHLTDHKRHTTLEHAVIDLYVCSYAHRFMGTNGSSFSDTIDILRRLRGLRGGK